MTQHQPILSPRAGHSTIAAAGTFIGGYNLWAVVTGLRNGAVWSFGKKSTRLVFQVSESGFYWTNIAGRLAFACIILGVAAACDSKLLRERHGGK